VKTVDCCREQDVLDALTSGRWPGRADADLRAHVTTCGLCADVIDVAGALLDCRDEEPSDARIPSSAVMWWRAQMRARQEAAREAARPITVAQVIASVAAIALTVAAVVALSPQVGEVFGGLLGGWVAGVREAAPSDTTVIKASSALLAGGWMLPVLMIGVWLVLAPVAIYFAVADD
jgi:hypothetical protein